MFQSLNAKRLTVLAYHAIDDPASFQRHLRYLERVAHPVSLDRVLQYLLERRALPNRAVLITFDDGHRSVLEHALPLMRLHGVPGVAFVVTGLLDSDQPFWWTEVEDLVAFGGTSAAFPRLSGHDLVRKLKTEPDDVRLATIEELRRTAAGPARRIPHLRRKELLLLERGGIAVESHSMSHAMLSRCDDAKLEAELRRSHLVLGDVLGRETRAFAYPDGDVDDRVSGVVASAGYRAAFLFDHRVNQSGWIDPLRVSRVRVNSHSSMDRFATIVSGLHPFIERIRVTGRRPHSEAARPAR